MLGLPLGDTSQSFFDSQCMLSRFVQPRRNANPASFSSSLYGSGCSVIKGDRKLSNGHDDTVAPCSYRTIAILSSPRQTASSALARREYPGTV